MKNIKFILTIFTAFSISFNAYGKSAEYHLLMMSDIHLGGQSTMELAPKAFNPQNDLDEATFQMLLSSMQQVITAQQLTPQSGLLLGDLVDHVSSGATGSTEARIKELSASFMQVSQWSAQLNFPFSYVFGNNDSLLGDYNAFDASNQSPYDVAKNNNWAGGFTTQQNYCVNKSGFPCLITEDKNNGEYTEYLAPKLLLIVVNSVTFNRYEACDTVCHAEFSWLSQQLLEANKRHDSILIAMHIPPGTDMNANKVFWQADTLNQFLQVIKPSEDNILSILTAHTHMEEIQMIRTASGHLIPVIYSAGLSTAHGNAPAFKYLTLQQDQNQWILKDYQTYSFSNKSFQLYYDFQTTYCNNANMPSIAACLESYLQANQLPSLLVKMNDHYAAGNVNFTGRFKDQNAADLIVNKS